MTNAEVRIADVKFKLDGNVALIGPAGADGEYSQVSAANLLDLSEFIATAYDAITGDEYRPVVISERGYVAEEDVFVSVENDGNGVERDCE